MSPTAAGAQQPPTPWHVARPSLVMGTRVPHQCPPTMRVAAQARALAWVTHEVLAHLCGGRRDSGSVGATGAPAQKHPHPAEGTGSCQLPWVQLYSLVSPRTQTQHRHCQGLASPPTFPTPPRPATTAWHSPAPGSWAALPGTRRVQEVLVSFCHQLPGDLEKREWANKE